MKKTLTFLMLAFVLISNAQESTLLRLNYNKGDKYKMSIEVSQKMGAAGIMDMKMIMEMDIINVKDDTYDSKIKFTKIAMNSNAGGQEINFDSDMKDEELDDMGKMMKTQMAPMLSAIISAKGNNLGEVTEMKVEPNVPGLNDIGNQLSNVTYPKEAIKVGSTWEMEKESKGMKMKFVYTVKSISENEIILDISGSILGLAEGDITGDMNIDKKTGVPMESNIAMKMSVQGQTIDSNISLLSEKI
ncbi:hypothetical protein [Thalassobellus sediminis]|uniref:hypothetical protein n=1 Tax=Thalassobellus sediminis TaxID=3367753 RepID=UPI0037BA8E7F